MTARDVLLHPYFAFLYAKDVLIRLSANFDYDRFSVWNNCRIFSMKMTELSSFFLVSKALLKFIAKHIAKRKGRTVVEKWQDKREVPMLSSHYSGKMVESNTQTKGGEKKKKPESVMSYNNFMCGVDKMDQLMFYYSPLQKTLK